MGDHEDQPATNSIEEEVDPQEQDVVGGGVRSYECIFCKRGFTTAQALGGHMNIHRKDRAKSTSSRPSNYLSNNNQDHSFYANPSRFHHPIFASFPQSYISSTSPNQHQEGNNIHNTTYVSSTSSTKNHENNHDQDVDGMITSPSREMSSNLQFGWSIGEDKDSRKGIRGGDKEDELDLELRLGQI